MTELSPFWKKGKSEPMKTVRKDRHGGKYQNRIFLLLLLMAVVPLLIAGSISYKVYLDEVTRQTDLSMEAMMWRLRFLRSGSFTGKFPRMIR